MTESSKPSQAELVKYAQTVREGLSALQQNEVFRVAVEVGYLAAKADGTVDAREREALVDAINVLSDGAVIEWEVDAIIDEVQGAKGRIDSLAKQLGEKLKDVGQAEAGLLVGAFVAQSTSGIDKKEARVLRGVGKNAGLTDAQIKSALAAVGATDAD